MGMCQKHAAIPDIASAYPARQTVDKWRGRKDPTKRSTFDRGCLEDFLLNLYQFSTATRRAIWGKKRSQRKSGDADQQFQDNIIPFSWLGRSALVVHPLAE